jgi:hypothetical protein
MFDINDLKPIAMVDPILSETVDGSL